MDKFSLQKAADVAVRPVVGILPFPGREEDVWLVGGMLSPVGGVVYAALKPVFKKKGYELQFFPEMLGRVSKEVLQYNFPGGVPALSDVNEIEFRKAVFAALGMEINPAAGYLIRLDAASGQYQVATILLKKAKDFIAFASAYADDLPARKKVEKVLFSKTWEKGFNDVPEPEIPMFSVTGGGGSPLAGRGMAGSSGSAPRSEGQKKEEIIIRHRFGTMPKRDIHLLADVVEGIHDDETLKLAEEVEAKILQLVMADFPVEVIETMLQRAVKLSRIRITKDWKILLTDYGKEIKMRQLPKTLFLWFLKNPDGCRLKDLQDHRDELLAIYKKLTNQGNAAAVVASIDALVNPIGPSFSEKSAAVKLAFLKEIPDRIAKNYYIHGPQGGEKAIGIDRGLVDWEVEI